MVGGGVGAEGGGGSGGRSNQLFVKAKLRASREDVVGENPSLVFSFLLLSCQSEQTEKEKKKEKKMGMGVVGGGGGGCYNGGAVQILEQGHQVLQRSTLCGTAELEWPPFVKYTPRLLRSLFSATPRKRSSRKRCLSPPLPKLLIRHASVVPGCPETRMGGGTVTVPSP